MKKFILTLACFYSALSFGQFIDNQRFGLFDAHHPFSQEYITKNKVEQAWCSRVMKPEGQPINDQGLMTSWEFNRNGDLTRKLESFMLGAGTKDTTAVFLEYDASGNCTLELVSDGDGYYAHRFQYNDSNEVTDMAYTRETSISGKKTEFLQGKRYDILGERYSYAYNDGQLTTKTTYNTHNKPYLKTNYKYDDLGYLREVELRYIITRKTQSSKFSYDDHGRIGSESVKSDFGFDKIKKWVYSYDKVGNMTEAKFYVGDQLKTTRQFMYDKKSLLVDAELIKDEGSGAIEIRQYSYTFWNENQ